MWSRRVENGLRQALARTRVQCAHEDLLGRLGLGAVAARGTSEAFGQTQAGPVRRAVDRAVKAQRIDKRLEQQQRVAKALEPIARKPLLAQRKHLGAQVGVMPVRQNQEAAVVGNQLEPPILQPGVPADPLVACAALERGGRKAQYRHPDAVVLRRVTQGLSDLRYGTQVVMAIQQMLELLIFIGPDGPDRDLRQIHATSASGPQWVAL